ncbi:hypothetical protein FIU83_03740 [Halomonas sp. THAF5a]|nr:hypothetical protein FIU83_03740 [Halomonas sp. THAF5a]
MALEKKSDSAFILLKNIWLDILSKVIHERYSACEPADEASTTIGKRALFMKGKQS